MPLRSFCMMRSLPNVPSFNMMLDSATLGRWRGYCAPLGPVIRSHGPWHNVPGNNKRPGREGEASQSGQSFSAFDSTLEVHSSLQLVSRIEGFSHRSTGQLAQRKGPFCWPIIDSVERIHLHWRGLPSWLIAVSS